MADTANQVTPDNAGAAFFGFMGVTLALILASRPLPTQISELHTVRQRLAQGSAVFRSGDPVL